jgi:hypothetical protein
MGTEKQGDERVVDWRERNVPPLRGGAQVSSAHQADTLPRSGLCRRV